MNTRIERVVNCQNVTVKGGVKSAHDQKPLGDVLVSVSTEVDHRYTFSHADGSFFLPSVESGGSAWLTFSPNSEKLIGYRGEYSRFWNINLKCNEDLDMGAIYLTRNP